MWCPSPWPPHTSSSTSSPQANHCPHPGFTSMHLGWALFSGSSWRKHRAQLACFPSTGDHCLSLTNSKVWKTVVSFFFSYFFFSVIQMGDYLRPPLLHLDQKQKSWIGVLMYFLTCNCELQIFPITLGVDLGLISFRKELHCFCEQLGKHYKLRTILKLTSSSCAKRYVLTNSQGGIIHFHSMQLLREERKYLFVHGKIHLLLTHTEFSPLVSHIYMFLLGMLHGQDLDVLPCAPHPTQPSKQKPWYHQGSENLKTKARIGAGLSARVPPFMLFQVLVGSPQFHVSSAVSFENFQSWILAISVSECLFWHANGLRTSPVKSIFRKSTKWWPPPTKSSRHFDLWSYLTNV